MKKTFIATAIALSIGSVASVQAQTITVTNLIFGGVYSTSGTLNSNGNGTLSSVDNFSGFPWAAEQQNWFDTHSGSLSWSGTYSYTYGPGGNETVVIEDFTYTFSLSSNQVAAGAFFDWNGNNNIPVLTIYDCPITGGGACSGVSLPMVTNPFPGAVLKFNGTTTDDFPVSGVPVPAAVWLMGSGLLGLIGVARRRKFQSAFE